jgi:FkbM family methyltransferase
MSQFRASAKRLLRQAGVFPITRSLYRRLSPAVHAAKRADRNLYSTFIKKGELVFDVGANLGAKSEIFLECGARVVAVEPNPLCKPTLQYLFGSNENIILLPKALAATEGKMVLHFAGTSATASLRENWAWVDFEGTPVATQVEVTTLDKLIEQFGVPDFCKIDVEGVEFEVLQGLSQSLPRLCFEYHLSEADRFKKCLDHLAKLSEFRLNFIHIDGPKFVLPEWIRVNDLDYGLLPPEGECFVIASPS